jgi:2-polyprenyl-3-methyl-5-hydroxy-6-metoxy-1,4-benzoquinol methylase
MHAHHEEITEVIAHHWNDRAPSFDREVGHGVHSSQQREAWLKLLAGIAGQVPRRVLDVGCGTGVLSLMLADLGHSVTGIDLASGMLDVARAKAQRAALDIEFRNENACVLSDADAAYDLVIARHVIWTLPDPAIGVAEWMRVLRPGGSLALIEGKWANNEMQPRFARSPRALLGNVAELGLSLASRLTRRKPERLYARQYRRIEAQLPFSGGPPAERLMTFLRRSGLHEIACTSLMDPMLWGETPAFPRYLVTARR